MHMRSRRLQQNYEYIIRASCDIAVGNVDWRWRKENGEFQQLVWISLVLLSLYHWRYDAQSLICIESDYKPVFAAKTPCSSVSVQENTY
jgi:hypothetical protein